MVMNRADPDWATITSYENLPGCPQPMAATRAWLRERGIDWMPLSDNEIRTDALRRLGLHPDQPSSIVAGRRLRPGGTLPQNAKYDDRCPRGTRPEHRDGILTRAAVLKQALDVSARRGPMMTRRSAQ
jgi:hypothetical protein